MFPSRARLRRADFPAVLKKGRRVSSPHFIVVSSSDVSGYAVVLPKKVLRRSVDRHRVKRLVFEILRTLPLPPALCVFPRAIVPNMSYGEMCAELTELLSKIQK